MLRSSFPKIFCQTLKSNVSRPKQHSAVPENIENHPVEVIGHFVYSRGRETLKAKRFRIKGEAKLEFLEG